MNKITASLIASSLLLGGFAVASENDNRHERYEREGHYEQHERYEGKGHKGKFCNKHGKRSGRLESMIEHLDLNDEQVTQVRNIRGNYKPKMASLRDKMKDNRKKLRDEMHEDTIDQAKIKELAQTIGKLKADKIILRSEMRTDIHKVLSDEQRKKMKSRAKHHR